MVRIQVAVESTPADVWHAVVDPDLAPRWMGGYRFVTEWAVNGSLEISGLLNGKPYRETGTLLAFEPAKVLQYSHWSRLWRVPDTPGNRAILTISIQPRGPGSLVSLQHELPAVPSLAEHSRFFWTVALDLLRRLVEAPTTRTSGARR